MKQLLTILLVIAGLSVGAMSLYMASLSGVMGKMGLVGSDFYHEIDQNELARWLRGQAEEENCGVLAAARLIPGYLLSRGQERVVGAADLGRARIVCGVKQVQDGNTERGVYTMIKGLYYLKSHFVELRSLVQVDGVACQLLAERQTERWVESYLSASRGRAHDVVFEVYKQVEEARGRVEELCTN